MGSSICWNNERNKHISLASTHIQGRSFTSLLEAKDCEDRNLSSCRESCKRMFHDPESSTAENGTAAILDLSTRDQLLHWHSAPRSRRVDETGTWDKETRALISTLTEYVDHCVLCEISRARQVDVAHPMIASVKRRQVRVVAPAVVGLASAGVVNVKERWFNSEGRSLCVDYVCLVGPPWDLHHNPLATGHGWYCNRLPNLFQNNLCVFDWLAAQLKAMWQFLRAVTAPCGRHLPHVSS